MFTLRRKKRNSSPSPAPSLTDDTGSAGSSKGVLHAGGAAAPTLAPLDFQQDPWMNDLYEGKHTSLVNMQRVNLHDTTHGDQLLESDNDSIQNSPEVDTYRFDAPNFDNKKTNFMRGSFAEQLEHAPQGPPTGYQAPSLVTKPSKGSLRRQSQPGDTIKFNRPPSFAERSTTSRNDTHGRGNFELNRQASVDDESLPFAATRQMASRGRVRSLLPEIRTGIVMSNEKFENYRKSLSSLEMVNRQNSVVSKVDEGESEDEENEEELDERNRKKALALARQQQEAHLAVHRQKMNKMTGNQVQNTTTLDAIEADDDDIMEDVPLSILRAHGFPKTLRKPQPSPPRANSAEITPMSAGSGGADPYGPPSSGSAKPPLPSVFGDKQVTGRGLVAEIAREEEAKRQRQLRNSSTLLALNESRFDDARSITPSSMNGLMQGEYQPQQTQSVPNGGLGQNQLRELQAQIQQMNEMQFQLYSQLTGAPPMSRSQSNFFGQQSMYGMPYTSRPASLRSYNPHVATPHTPTFSGDMGRFSMPETNMPRRMRAVEDEDDEDDDEAWRKMMEKRQTLRAEWDRIQV